MSEDLYIDKFFCNVPVYIINLEDSIDRKDKILEQFSHYKNLHFVKAVDGRNEKKFREKYIVNYSSSRKFTTSLIAVICSHAKAIKMSYENGDEYACVFEDDVNLELLSKYKYTLNDLISYNIDWDIVQLYYTENIQENYSHFLSDGIKLLKREINYSGTCYIINRIGMKKILNQIIITDGVEHFDIKKDILDVEHIIFNYINSYIVNLPCVYYFSDNMTFESYEEDMPKVKLECQLIHKNVSSLLKSFYLLE